jgi:hypothetical protein
MFGARCYMALDDEKKTDEPNSDLQIGVEFQQP